MKEVLGSSSETVGSGLLLPVLGGLCEARLQARWSQSRSMATLTMIDSESATVGREWGGCLDRRRNQEGCLAPLAERRSLVVPRRVIF